MFFMFFFLTQTPICSILNAYLQQQVVAYTTFHQDEISV